MRNYMLMLFLTFIFAFSGCTQKMKDTVTTKLVEQSTQITLTETINTTKETDVELPTTDTQPVFQQDLKGVDDDMKHIVEFLTENKNVQMATIGTDGKPAIRTIQFQFFENGRIYFQTDTNASVYKDLQSQPYIEFVSTSKDDIETLRVKAKVVFEYNKELIQRVLTMGPNIKKIYGSADNPILIMFYLDHGSASIFEFSDKRQEITLRYQW